MRRLIVAITGASGVIYGVRLLEVARDFFETHLIITDSGRRVMEYELDVGLDYVKSLAHRVYWEHEIDAPVSSGSFNPVGMVIAPCSTKTLALIAHGISINLVTRAAEVVLKERRKLILLLRETPLNLIHIENMRLAASAGAIIMPASPAFYHKPKCVGDMVDFIVGRILDLLEVEHNLYRRWSRGADDERRF